MPKKTILIADNSLINRTYLGGILSGEYDILEAADGQMALDILREHGDEIAVVLLDLVMPKKGGYEVLDEMSDDDQLRQIPVIVVTAESETSAEAKALDAGAMDFITKPFEPEIAKRRIKSVISAKELEEYHIKSRILEELQYQSDHDELTGIFSRLAFYRDTHSMLMRHPNEDYILIRWDIEKFKLVNELFGMKIGDDMLRAAANSLVRHVGSLGTYGRFGSDNFVMCVPEASVDVETLMASISEDIRSSFGDVGIVQTVIIATGIFRIYDHSLQVGNMCDRAGMALQTIKGNYSRHFAYYDDKIRERLLEEQDILDNMEAALENHEFEVYLQPVYSLSTGHPASAEALSRWNRPGKGIISPGVFIPLFERNGFISKLDYYMWDQVCHILTSRAEQGLQPLPISVNLSRRSVYNPHLFEDIVELVERHHVPPSLFRIEVTESAYIDNAAQLISTVKKLQDYGFPVLMDDFGSGYSSFNTLKDIPVDMLKIDMKFMEGFEQGGRIGTILASILRMTKWLGIPVIAEGVETTEQYEYLRSIGCDYTQGFLFARPMPYSAFEEHLEGPTTLVPEEETSFDIKDVNDVMGCGRLFNRVMDDVLDAYCIYEFRDDSLEAVRASAGYLDLFGYDMVSFKRESVRILEHIAPADRPFALQACNEAIETRKPRNLIMHVSTLRDGGEVRTHATITCVGKAGASAAMIFIAFHVIECHAAEGLMPSCPFAEENCHKKVY